MPADFEKCMATPGHIVRTKELGDGKYMAICIVNGKSYGGEVKHKVGSKLKEALKK